VRMTLVCIDVEGRVLRIVTFEEDGWQDGGDQGGGPARRVPWLAACLTQAERLHDETLPMPTISLEAKAGDSKKKIGGFC
jgi:hypothetical protein